MRILAALVLIGCGSSGEPGTYRVDGESRARFAYSGPGGFCCDINDMGNENVGWQIWFTNTESCPTREERVVGMLMVLSPMKLPQHSGAMPELPSLEIDIHPVPYMITSPMAYLGADESTNPAGHLSLETFTRELVAGSFNAEGSEAPPSDDLVMFGGDFVAPYCDIIAESNGSK
ncbi:MAG: hypothetical protein AB7O24_20405 [Kofleriaceae bacterium]